MENQNKSLLIIPVTCHLCGHLHIPFRSLQRRMMVPQSNIFGIQQFVEAYPGKEYCNYNLVRVAICPNCLFASGSTSDFISESKLKKERVEPFDKAPIVKQWCADIGERKQLVEPYLDGLQSEARNLEQGLISCRLAVIACLALLKAEEEKDERARNFNSGLKAANYMLIQAELLMSNNRTSEAEQSAKTAFEQLQKIFPYLRREASIKAGYLSGMLALYFGNTKVAAQSFDFIRQYEKNNKIKFGSEEQKTLALSLKSFSDVYAYRDEFARGKLKGFNKPFQY